MHQPYVGAESQPQYRVTSAQMMQQQQQQQQIFEQQQQQMMHNTPEGVVHQQQSQYHPFTCAQYVFVPQTPHQVPGNWGYPYPSNPCVIFPSYAPVHTTTASINGYTHNNRQHARGNTYSYAPPETDAETRLTITRKKLDEDESKMENDHMFHYPKGAFPRIVVAAPGATNENTILVSAKHLCQIRSRKLFQEFPNATHVEVKPLSKTNMTRLTELCAWDTKIPPVEEYHAFVVFADSKNAQSATNMNIENIEIHGRVCDLTNTTIDVGDGPVQVLHMSDGDQENIFVKHFPPYYKANRAEEIHKLCTGLLDDSEAVVSIKICDKGKNNTSATIGALIRFRTAALAATAIELISSMEFQKRNSFDPQLHAGRKTQLKKSCEEKALELDSKIGKVCELCCTSSNSNAQSSTRRNSASSNRSGPSRCRVLVESGRKFDSRLDVYEHLARFGAIETVEEICNNQHRYFLVTFVRVSGEAYTASERARAFYSDVQLDFQEEWVRRATSMHEPPAIDTLTRERSSSTQASQVEKEPSPVAAATATQARSAGSDDVVAPVRVETTEATSATSRTRTNQFTTSVVRGVSAVPAQRVMSRPQHQTLSYREACDNTGSGDAQTN